MLNVFWLQGIAMAELLESHIKKDPNFDVPAERHLGLVVFCLKVRSTSSVCRAPERRSGAKAVVI